MLVHNPGDEAWLYLDGFSNEISVYFLQMKGVEGLKYLDIRIRDTIIISKNTKEKPCLELPNEENYFECIKSKVISELNSENKLNCSTWLSNILKNWSLPECKNLKDFLQTTDAIQTKFYSKLARHGDSDCFYPCNHTKYSAMWAFGNIGFFLLSQVIFR